MGDEIKELTINKENSDKSLLIPDIDELPDEAKGVVASSLIDLTNSREERQLEALKLKLEYEDRQKQRDHEAEMKRLDREALEQDKYEERAERREERDFKAAENERNREHESTERVKDREAEKENNIQNSRSTVLAALNIKNIAFGIAILAAVIIGSIFFIQQNGKVMAPDKPSELKNNDVNDVYSRFVDAGFTNIDKIEDYTSTDAKNDQKVKTITIKGRDDYKEDSKFDPSDKVAIVYYVVGKGFSPYSSGEVKDMNYSSVETQFNKEGFKKTSLVPVPIDEENQNKDGKVESVTIDGRTDFTKTDVFDKDVEVVIKYYAGKAEISKTNKQYAKEKYDDVVQELIEFKKVTFEPVYDGTDKNQHKIISVAVAGKTDYKPGEYNLDTPITVQYHELPEKKPVGENEALIADSAKAIKGKSYDEIAKMLSDLGFENISTKTVDTKMFHKPGEIISITIAGLTDFEAYSVFDKNSEIVIEYYVSKS